MKWRTFLVYNVTGALLWVSTWSAIGYFGGSHIEMFLRYQLYITIASAVGAISYFVYKRYTKTAKAKQ